MAKPRPTPRLTSKEQRARVVATLLGICRNLERLQVSAAGRRACREVAASLSRLK